MQALANVMEPLITPIIKRRGLAQASIILDWHKIVHDMADVCLPIKLSFAYGKNTGGTLSLWVESGTALRLEYAKDLIISCINGYYGYKAVEFLKFHQTSLKPKELANASRSKGPLFPLKTVTCHFNDIDSDDLRNALKSFGHTLGYRFKEL